MDLRELFQEQYGLNTVLSDDIAMLFGAIPMSKKEPDHVGLVIEELYIKNTDKFTTSFDGILTAINQKLSKTVKKVAVTVKIKNRHVGTQATCLLQYGFKIEKSDDKGLLFVKEI